MKKLIYGVILILSFLVLSSSVYASFPGSVFGYVTSNSCGDCFSNTLDGVLITSNGGGITSTSDGFYDMFHVPGTFTFTYFKAGYITQYRTITITSAGNINKDVCLSKSQ